MRLVFLSLLSGLLAACATSPQTDPARPAPSRPPVTRPAPPSEPAPAPIAGFRQPEILNEPGLEAIMQQSAPALERRFGEPRLAVSEGDMRKLQFVGNACVLDIFLYPLRPDGEPVATWAEARRQSDGAAVDRAACVQALSRR